MTTPVELAMEIVSRRVGPMFHLRRMSNPSYHQDEIDEIAAALRAYGDERARQERERCAQRLQAYKQQVQEAGALWWPIHALDDFIAALP